MTDGARIVSIRSNSRRALLPRLATATAQILERNRRPLTRAELHRNAGGHVAEAVAATCLWDKKTVPLGDYHSVVFTATIVDHVAAVVKVKSCPNAPALIEVSSAAERPSRKSPLSPDLSARMKAIEFTVDVHSGNHYRELRIRSIRASSALPFLCSTSSTVRSTIEAVVPIDVEVVSVAVRRKSSSTRALRRRRLPASPPDSGTGHKSLIPAGTMIRRRRSYCVRAPKARCAGHAATRVRIPNGN
jgi:hypothetical protein